jgi:hypothetical protein
MRLAIARLLRAAVLLGLVVVAAGELWRLRPAPSPGVGPDADIVAGCEWLAFAVAGYLCIAIAATLTAILTSAAPLARLAPPVIRRIVEVAVSTGLSALLAGTGVAAAGTHPGGPASVGSLDWPGMPDRTQVPGRPPAPTRPDAVVVVQPGDSLWTIAARHLEMRQPGRAPSRAEIAAAWPAWWQANRAAIGTDPNVIRPGQHLTVPPTTTPSTSHPGSFR